MCRRFGVGVCLSGKWRAVPRKAAQGYEERLLVLPHSLAGPNATRRKILRGRGAWTGFFIEKALHGKEMASRARLGTWLTNGFHEKMAA